MDLGIDGKIALVTGGTRGIGLSIVRCLLAEGARVVFCARTEADVERTTRALRMEFPDVAGKVLDIQDHTEVREWVAEVAAVHGRIDILVSNVSAQSFNWDASFQIDVKAMLNLVEACTPWLCERRGSAIVFIASQAAALGVPSYKAYSAMKAALISYAGSLSRELAPQGVRVNVVSPAEIEAPGGFWERMAREDAPLYGAAVAKSPIGRLGTPDEVARAVAFLASPAASYIAGVNLLVDHASREFIDF